MVGVLVIEVEEFGGPEVLVPREVPDLEAGPGEVVVKVTAADTLFVDTQIRLGAAREFFDVKPPYVPGGAVSGEVVSVGAGVDPAWIGRGVIAYTGGLEGHGGYAELAVVSACGLIPVPGDLGLREAAALVHDGVSAYGLFERAEIKARDRVLVVGATGGAGVLLIQLARAAGATVIAAAREQRKLCLARGLGADIVVDYSEPDWAEHVRDATGGAGARVVLDGVGGEIGRAAFDAVANGGWMSAHGSSTGGFSVIDPEEAVRRQVTVQGIGDMRMGLIDRKRVAAPVLEEAAAGRLRPLIGQTFPLERATEAHTAIEARSVIGKTLLIP
ncbi:zinc-binding dehydrogenase [Actinomadura rudentiformis]|uniref:zinc-binding dehydrogenase n=1 Tax=Actinomadura rudentiformis TaxID=359158 RepID=UPI00298F8D18|nr:zinc-binding dehydrogenase [Actinomadura rudentiformis]